MAYSQLGMKTMKVSFWGDSYLNHHSLLTPVLFVVPGLVAPVLR